MIFVWGRRVIRKKVGYVADFCPMCREPQAFLMNQLSTYRHLYFIPVSAKESLGYERICQGCKLALKGAPVHYVATPKKPTSVQEIVSRSFPKLPEVYADRLRIEEQVKKAPALIPKDLRYALIKQPFVVVSPLVESRYKRTSIDWVSILVLVGALGAVCLTPVVADAVAPDNEGLVFGVIAVLALCTIVGAFATEPRRYIKRSIIPRIAKTLCPLQPSESEITAALAELKRSGHKIGAKLRSPHLLRALAAGRG